jgi:cell division protein FtsL
MATTFKCSVLMIIVNYANTRKIIITSASTSTRQKEASDARVGQETEWKTLRGESKALCQQRRILAIQEKALGPDHPDVATSLENLALSVALFHRSFATVWTDIAADEKKNALEPCKKIDGIRYSAAIKKI